MAYVMQTKISEEAKSRIDYLSITAGFWLLICHCIIIINRSEECCNSAEYFSQLLQLNTGKNILFASVNEYRLYRLWLGRFNPLSLARDIPRSI